jgi:hypothetical protein
MKQETKHTHSFSVDTSCECGVMLSDYVRSLVVINADLIAALAAANGLIQKHLQPFLEDAFEIFDNAADGAPDASRFAHESARMAPRAQELLKKIAKAGVKS